MVSNLSVRMDSLDVPSYEMLYQIEDFIDEAETALISAMNQLEEYGSAVRSIEMILEKLSQEVNGVYLREYADTLDVKSVKFTGYKTHPMSVALRLLERAAFNIDKALSLALKFTSDSDTSLVSVIARRLSVAQEWTEELIEVLEERNF